MLAGESNELGRRFAPLTGAFVGRHDPLARLERALAASRALVVIAGEAGVGKTRLLTEFLSGSAHDRRVLYGRGRRSSVPFPMGPIIDALSSTPRPARPLDPVVGALRPLLPELSYLPPALPALRDPLAELHRVWRALQQLLGRLGPAVLVIDDYHLADRTTRDFVDFLVDELPDELVVVVASQDRGGMASSFVLRARRSRPDVVCEHIDLRPLDENEVRELVAARVGRVLDDESIRHICRTTAGVAFAVVEVASALATGEASIAGVGSAASDAILRRYRMMSPFAQSVVDMAAVADTELEPDVLAAALERDPEPVSEGLAEALDLGVLVETKEGLGFRHSLLRRLVYEALDPAARRRLHRRCALALEALRTTSYARLVHHHEAAGDVAKATAFAERAAEEALRLGDYGSAYSVLRGVVSQDPRSPDERAGAIFLFAEAALEGVDTKEAKDLVRGLLGDDKLAEHWRKKLTLQLARLLSVDDRSSAVRLLQRNLPRFEGSPDEIHALRYLASPWVVEGTAEEHLEWLRRAARKARELEPARAFLDPADEAPVLVDLGLDEGWRLLDDLREGEPGQDPRREFRSWVSLAESLTWTGDLRSAADCLVRALAISRAFPDPRFELDHALIRLVLDWLTGRWDGLDERAAKLSREVGSHRITAPHALVVLGSLRSAAGQHREADDLLRRGHEDACKGGHVPLAIVALAERGRLASRDDAHAGWRCVVEAASMARAKRMPAWEALAMPPLLELALLDGTGDPAICDVDGFEDRANEHSFPLRAPTMRHVRAVHCHAAARSDGSGPAWDEAGLSWESASSAWAEAGRALEAARAAERAGQCFSHTDSSRATDNLRAAADAFDRAGASWELHRVERRLRRLGVAWRRPRGRRGYGQSLSPREAETVELARAGKSNKEIASILFLSEKTIESHLASARRKTGFTRGGRTPS